MHFPNRVFAREAMGSCVFREDNFSSRLFRGWDICFGVLRRDDISVFYLGERTLALLNFGESPLSVVYLREL